jgi:hypothetical protein
MKKKKTGPTRDNMKNKGLGNSMNKQEHQNTTGITGNQQNTTYTTKHQQETT